MSTEVTESVTKQKTPKTTSTKPITSATPTKIEKVDCPVPIPKSNIPNEVVDFIKATYSPLETIKMSKYCKGIVKDSLIPNAGLGLFASKDFKEGNYIINNLGEIIAPYFGSYYTLEQKYLQFTSQEKSKNLLEIMVPKNEYPIYLDGSAYCGACYANDNNVATNARFVQKRSRSYMDMSFVTIRASKKIKQDDEIYVYYGEKYWSKLFYLYLGVIDGVKEMTSTDYDNESDSIEAPSSIPVQKELLKTFNEAETQLVDEEDKQKSSENWNISEV